MSETRLKFILCPSSDQLDNLLTLMTEDAVEKSRNGVPFLDLAKKTVVCVYGGYKAKLVGEFLQKQGLIADYTQSRHSVQERDRIAGRFNAGIIQALVVDSYSRKYLDISAIDLMINLVFPEEYNGLMHFGSLYVVECKVGAAVTFVNPSDQSQIAKLSQYIKLMDQHGYVVPQRLRELTTTGAQFADGPIMNNSIRSSSSLGPQLEDLSAEENSVVSSQDTYYQPIKSTSSLGNQAEVSSASVDYSRTSVGTIDRPEICEFCVRQLNEEEIACGRCFECYAEIFYDANN